jgi:hypothetical protein
MDEDFQTTIRARNKTFKMLRGKWIYETLTDYVQRALISMQTMNPSHRLTIIMRRTIDDIQEQLGMVKTFYEDVVRLEAWFQRIRGLFNQESIPWQKRQRQLDEVFQEVYSDVLRRSPKFKLEACRSFLPRKKRMTLAILGEWCRLWNSYLPGLFQYERFPGQFRTNGSNEVAFSKEKQMLITRAGKGIVSHMIATRGEEYFRLTYCTQKELDVDIITEYHEELVKDLRALLQETIHKQTQHWRMLTRSYDGVEEVRYEYELITESGEK